MSTRANLVRCNCSKHNGLLISRMARSRCHERELRSNTESKEDDVDGYDPLSDSSHMEDDAASWSSPSSSDTDDDTSRQRHVHTEVDMLCIRLYGDFVQHNSTQDSVTANLRTWMGSVGQYLPAKIKEDMPMTCKQLLARYRQVTLRLHRIPLCPGGCSLLEGVTPTVNYSCWCNGHSNQAWRVTTAGNVSAVLEYITVALSDVIKSWYVYM